MPSVPLGKKNYDRVVILVGSDGVNAFVNEAVSDKLKKESPPSVK